MAVVDILSVIVADFRLFGARRRPADGARRATPTTAGLSICGPVCAFGSRRSGRAAGGEASGGRTRSDRRPQTSGCPSRRDLAGQAETRNSGGSPRLVVSEKSRQGREPGTATPSARTNRPRPAGGGRHALSRPTADALQILSRLPAGVRSVCPCVPIPLATGSLAAAVRLASLTTSRASGRGRG
jgi:hypothetical protein